MLPLLMLALVAAPPGPLQFPVRVTAAGSTLMIDGEKLTVSLLVSAWGEVPTSGWRDPRLTPRLTDAAGRPIANDDGWLEFDLSARPLDGNDAARLEKGVVQASCLINRYAQGYPYRIRVYGAEGTEAETTSSPAEIFR